MNNFEKDYQDSLSAYEQTVKLNRIIKVITLGFISIDNLLATRKQKVDEDYESMCQYKNLINKNCELDAISSSIITLNGIRVSSCIFADISRIGTQGYPADWEGLRQIILTRDNYECVEKDVNCQPPLQIHHIVALSKGGTNKESNLITLCFFHHSLKHDHMRRELNGNIRS